MLSVHRFCIALFFFSASASTALGRDKTLDIDPVIQQTMVWCWVAVSEMVFTHFGIDNVNPGSNYQCGIVGALAQPGSWAEGCEYQCFQPACIVPAGSASKLVKALKQFPKEAATALQQEQPRVTATAIGYALSKTQITSRIDDEKPIIAGINPSGRPSGLGASEHVALIIGYEDDGEVLIVNDPAPFALVSWSNPYVSAGGEELEQGQYRIDREDFIESLSWGETIKVEVDGTVEPDDLPQYCCVLGGGRFGPFPNTSVRLGHSCQVQGPWGPVSGRACH
jgi:hypothetical protein